MPRERSRTVRVANVLTLLGVAILVGCSMSTAPVATSTPDPLARPLALPTPAAGGRCPRTEWRDIGSTGAPETLGASGSYTVLGGGPAYPIVYNLDRRAGTLSFSGFIADTKAPYWDYRWNKVRWIVEPRYRGPVLVRGARIDGPGDVRFHEPALTELRIPSDLSEGWRDHPGALSVPGPGCYAMQVDVLDRSYALVFEVVT